jgi:hypothetical protein
MRKSKALMIRINAYPKISAYPACTSIEWTLVRLQDKTVYPGRFHNIAIESNVRTTHDAPTAGHLGITRLLAAVTGTSWWPNMRRTLQHYVRRCVTCNKATRHKPYCQIESREVPNRPFEHVLLDLITDLPECDGYDAVVIFICMLTKRTIVEPTTKTIATEQLAKVTHHVVFRHFGLPRKLISDRDPRLMSDFSQTLFRAIGAKLNISTSYHPQTNCQTERVNQTWEQVIRCYVHPLHDD